MAAWKDNLFILLFIILLSFYNCHYLPDPEDIIQGVVTERRRSLNRRSTEQPLRIMVSTASTSIAKLKLSKRHLILDKLLPEAVTYFSKTLNVRKTTSPIRLQRQCKNGQSVMKKIHHKTGMFNRYCIGECAVQTYCGTVLVPTAHLDLCRTCNIEQTQCLLINSTGKSEGVSNTDFLLYVSANTTEHCKNKKDVLAYAASCQLEQTVDRPVAGFVNFCEEKISSSIHYSYLLAIVKHEIFHALGFSSSLYGYYRADDGTPLTPRLSNGRLAEKWSNKVVKEVVRPGWVVAGSNVSHKVEMIVLPRVLQEVRQHFNCSNLEGAEIENQGGTGRRQTHWEKRLFENEAMTGVFTHNPVFSRITLALMEDTGWYKAKYDMAEELDWGRNAGCLFAQNSCKAWINTKAETNHTILPYCIQISPKDHTHTACTHGHDSVGICNLVKYNAQLPAEYRYFNVLPGVSNPEYYGGETALADYCPYVQELDWKRNGKTIRGSNCKHKNNNLNFEGNYALEEYGANSSCFLQGKAWTRRSCRQTVTAVDWGSGCYSYTCTYKGVVVSILDHSYPCWLPGLTLDVKLLNEKSWLHQGSLICPPCQDLCGASCPRVETKAVLYNWTSNEHATQSVLVCSALDTQPKLTLGFLILMSFLNVLYS